jgi:hypothetical protein
LATDAPEQAPDAALAALDDLVVAIHRTQRLLEDAVSRAEALRSRRLTGQPYRDIVPDEPRPLLVEVVSDSITRLVEAGSRFRRAQARALRDEGLTMEAIAELFGVTRQRVSHLLTLSALRDAAPAAVGSRADGRADGDADGRAAGRTGLGNQAGPMEPAGAPRLDGSGPGERNSHSLSGTGVET